MTTLVLASIVVPLAPVVDAPTAAPSRLAICSPASVRTGGLLATALYLG